MALLVILFLAEQVLAAQTSGERLASIRQRMAGNLARLPNYTCLETVERTQRPPGSRRYSVIDRLRLEVAYVGGGELYAWPGAGKFEDKSVEQIVGRGALIGTGSFALHARAVFASNAPAFTPAGEQESDGHKVVRFDFQITRAKSRYSIRTGPEPVIVAYHGFFEADPVTFDPVRLEVLAEDLPAELQLQSSGEMVHYARMRIGESDFLLPVSSELWMVQTDGTEDRNRTRFEQCHQYSGESTVRFDVVDGDVSAAAAAGPIELPAGLSLETRIRETIDHAKAAIGDQVHATVVGDVKRGGRVLVPKGAVVSGRITRLEVRTQRSYVYLGVRLRLESIQFAGRRGDFSGEIESIGIGPEYFVGRDNPGGEQWVYARTRDERLMAGTRLVIGTR
jgi:hypothetical protein